MLELRNVCKRFSGIVAVDDVSFSARAGEITGYLGPNGSGKSTTMKMITGPWNLGNILFNGDSSGAIWSPTSSTYRPRPHLWALSGLEYLTWWAIAQSAREARGGPHRWSAAAILLHGDRHAPISAYRRECGRRCCSSAARCTTRSPVAGRAFSGLDVGTGWCCGA